MLLNDKGGNKMTKYDELLNLKKEVIPSNTPYLDLIETSKKIFPQKHYAYQLDEDQLKRLEEHEKGSKK